MSFGDSSKEPDSNSLEYTIKYFKGLRNKQQKEYDAKSMQKLRLSMHYFPINIEVYEVFWVSGHIKIHNRCTFLCIGVLRFKENR